MSVDDDEGLIDRCGGKLLLLIYLIIIIVPLSLPDARLDVTPADALPTRAFRTAAHGATASSRESVQGHRTQILQGEQKKNRYLVEA